GFTRLTDVGGYTGNNGQLSIEPTTAGQLGTDERVTISVPANVPDITNGMVAPWMYNNRDSQFLTYSDFGFVSAGFTASTSGALTAASSTLNDRTLISGTSTMAAGAQLNTYALRIDGNVSLGTVADTTAKINIASGGLITNGAVTVAPGLVFGSAGSPAEALIANNNNLIIGSNANPTTSGQITASSISKSGTGNMFMDGEQQTFNGNIALNAGGLFLRSVATGSGGLNSNVGGLGGTIIVNGFNSTVGFRSDLTFSSALTATSVSGATATLPNVTGLAVGMVVTGTGPTAGVSYITSIVGNTVTVSNAAFTGTPALTFTPLGAVFNNSVYVAPGNALISINVDRVNSTSLTGKTNAIAGDLIFGGAPGEQGQTINFNYSTANVNYSFQVNGTTNLGPVGNAVMYMNSTSSNVTLAGGVTGSGTLVKQGASTLFLGLAGAVPTSANTNTGGIVLVNGTLQATSGQQADANGNVVNSALGSGDITLAGGTLNLRVEGFNNATNRVYTFADNPNVNVIGNTSISVDRVDSAGGSVKTLAFNNLNIGGQVLTVGSGNTYSLRFNNVAITGTPTFTTNNELILANVSDGGGNLFIAKNGASSLWMDGTNNTYGGGTFVNQGTLRFGSPAGASATAQAGTGTITVNPSAQIILENLTNLNASTGQMIDVRSIPASLGIVRVQAAVDPTPFITENSSGLLMIPSMPLSLDLGAIGDGTFQLATSGANTYSGLSLGVGAGNVYRLGGNAQNFTLSAANNNVLTGTASLQIGSLASTGGSFAFNNTNDYTGGTTVVRGITGQWFTSNVGANNFNTPLGTGAVESFGQTIAYGTSGNYNQNTFNFHPGATIRIDSNSTLTAITASSSTGATATLPNVNGLAVGMSVTGTGTTAGSVITAINGNVITVSGATFTGAPALTFASNDRWDDSSAVDLNGMTLSYNGMNNQVSTEKYGAATFAAGSRVALSSNGTGQVQLTVPSLTRSGNGTMVFTTSAANRLGLPAGNNSERFVMSSGAPTLAGSVNSGAGAPTGVAPAYFIDGTAVSFVSYDPTYGFRTLLSTATPAANQVAYSRIIPVGTFAGG
ncbi:MAG: outer rane autotransporter barrel domain protein, partial [Verrucomicrobiaceae bacterium]|nr:outer rane autotransporter barrel domain protein [Verrucomicrobiaceae bacterium]